MPFEIFKIVCMYVSAFSEATKRLGDLENMSWFAAAIASAERVR